MITELLKETHLDTYLSYFRTEKKKFLLIRCIYGLILFCFFALGILFIKEYLWLMSLPIIFYMGYKIPYLNLILNKKKSDLINSYLFPQFLGSFLALLSSSGNVYQTLVETVEYTDDPLRSELNNLIEKIEQGNNRDDYLAFADYIGTSEAYMIMDMIYQFSEYGVQKEAIQELENYIHTLQENKVDELIQQKMIQMDKYGYMPIFISLFLTLGFAAVIFFYFFQDITKAINIL